MSTPRVSLILPSFAGGGAERVVLAVAGGFRDRGCSPSLIVFSGSGPLRQAVPAGVPVTDLGTPHARRPLAAVAALSRRLAEESPSAAFSFTTAANLLAALARRRSRWRGPLVAGEHSDPRSFDRHALLGVMARPLLGACYRDADRIITVSEGLGALVVDLFRLPPGKVVVIRNGIDGERLRSAAAQSVDHPFFAPGAPPVVLAAGRMIPRKGFGTLVRAWIALRRSVECRLIILGDGPLRPRLSSQIAAAGLSQEASLPGHLDNPWSFMASSRVVAVPSLGGEGFVLVVAEAMACGVPVVSADCDFGPRELVEEGVSGLLVPPGDAVALARALRRVLADPALASSLAAGGRARAQGFTVEAMVDRYVTLALELSGGA